MKLYYSPGACSLSPHIALYESGLPFETVLAPTKTKKLPDGTDFRTINAKGYVPVLELDNGERLTEGPAIVQYIGDQVPAKNLVPANGTMERYRLQEWLNFITSELHKGFSPLFNPATPENYKPVARQRLSERFTWLEGQLAGRDYLAGDQFSVADGYLFVVLRWAKALEFDFTALPNLGAFVDRVGSRPAVQQALAAEAGDKK